MKLYFLIALLLVSVIEVYPEELDLESNLDEVLKANNITIPEVETSDLQPELISELTEESFKKFIQENSNVFVYFYVPFCTSCRDFNMVLEEIAQNVQQTSSSVKFVKIDSEKHPAASESLPIKEYPALFFIRNETVIIPFEGENTSENITLFIQNCLNTSPESSQKNITNTESKNDMNINEITELSNLNNILRTQNVKNIILYLGDSKHFISIYQHFSKEKNVLVYFSNSTEVLNHFSVNHDEFEVFLFKYSNKNKNYTEYNINFRQRNIRLDIFNELIATHMKNSPSLLTDKNLDRILDTGFPSIVIVLPDFSNSTMVDHLVNELNIARKQFPSDLWYFVTNFQEPNVKAFIDLLRVTPEMLPTIIIFDGSNLKDNNSVKKYLWNRGEINVQNLKGFIQDFYNNNLQFYLASEEIPAQPINEFGVYKIVGKTFPELVLNSTGKEILLLLCTEYHDDCPKLFNIYNNVGRKLSANGHLIIGTIDPASNEIDNLTLDFIPYLMYLHDTPDKLAHHVKFEGNFTTQQMVEFVKNNSKQPINEITLENQTELYEAEQKINITRKSIEDEGNEEENESEGLDLGDLSQMGFGGQEGEGGEDGNQFQELFQKLMESDVGESGNGDLGSLGGDGVGLGDMKGLEDLMKQEMNQEGESSEQVEESSTDNTVTSNQQTQESQPTEVKQESQHTENTEVHSEANPHVKEDF